MPRRDLPYPARPRPWWRRALGRWRDVLEAITAEWGPLALAVEGGLAGFVAGCVIWLLVGLAWPAFTVAGLAYAAVWRWWYRPRRRRR